MTNEVAVHAPSAPMGFQSAAGFELIQRVAKGFAASKLVPETYRGNLPDCMIALEMATRMGVSPLMCMQNLYIVHGNPGWSSKFLIACFNQCGRFSALRYEFDRDDKGTPVACRAWAVEKATNERLVGSTVSLAMAKDEGWSTKAGSKWKTMPEQMLMYRAAGFFVRTYAPEISMGLQTSDELIDMGDVEEISRPTSTTLASIKACAIGAPATDPADPGEPPTTDSDGVVTFTFAQIMDGIVKASTVDDLQEVGSLITHCQGGAGQQQELNDAYTARLTELEG